MEILVDVRHDGTRLSDDVSLNSDGGTETGVSATHTGDSLTLESLLSVTHFLEIFTFLVFRKNETSWETAEDLIENLQEVEQHVAQVKTPVITSQVHQRIEHSSTLTE